MWVENGPCRVICVQNGWCHMYGCLVICVRNRSCGSKGVCVKTGSFGKLTRQAEPEPAWASGRLRLWFWLSPVKAGVWAELSRHITSCGTGPRSMSGKSWTETGFSVRMGFEFLSKFSPGIREILENLSRPQIWPLLGIVTGYPRVNDGFLRFIW